VTRHDSAVKAAAQAEAERVEAENAKEASRIAEVKKE
jgi:hypothetical protein